MPRTKQISRKGKLSLAGAIDRRDPPFDDAEVLAFAQAYLRIKNSDKRAFVEWFVKALAENE